MLKRTSAMHQRSSPFLAVTDAPTQPRNGLCAPVASITWSARIRYSPAGVSMVSVAHSLFCSNAGHPVAPAQVDMPELADALDQEALDVELLDVDEGRLAGELVAALLAQVERIDLVLAGEGAAHAPLDALGRDALVDAQALEDLQRLLRVADAARGGAFDADRVVLVQQDGRHAVARQRAGQGQAGQAAADDDDGVMADFAGGDFGRLDERIFRQRVAAALGEFVAAGKGCLRVR